MRAGIFARSLAGRGAPARAGLRGEIRAAVRLLLGLALPAALPLALLALWQIAAAEAWVAPQILPAPSIVLASFADLIRDGELWANLTVSLGRIVLGFALGAAAGLVVGVAFGIWPRTEQYFGPTLRALAQVPSIGWLPFFILIFGLGETLNAVLIAKACFVPTVLSTVGGIDAIDKRYLDVARALRLPRRALVLRLVLPAALPDIASGVRLALGQAWVSLIVVEMLADTEGVGYLMTWGRTIFQTDIVIVGMIVIGAIGFLMDTGLRRLERRLQSWRPEHA